MKHIKLVVYAALVTVSTFGAVVFTACNKVKCQDIVCKNGGACNNGVCSCPTGYTGTFCETAAISAIVYKNNTYTPIVITVNGTGATIPVGGSVAFTGQYSTDATGTATTSGAASSLGVSIAGGIIGLPINWNISNKFPSGDTLRVPLDIGSTYFFLRVANKGNEDIINYYVNVNFPYGQYYGDITIPHDGKTYDMGYYLAYPNSNVQTQTGSTSSVKYWPVTLPFTNNQSATVNVTD